MFRIYGNAWGQRSAGQYYRILTPLRALEKAGLATTFPDDPFQDETKRRDFLFTADVQLHFLTGGKAMHLQTQKLAEMKPAKNANGDLQYPPIMVFDMDDDIETISPLNPKFCILGTRNIQGELLMPEDELGIDFQDGGGPVMLWKHGQDSPHGTFDVGRNIINHAAVRKMAATCHAITCTGPDLAKVAERWGQRAFVFPNSILFDDYERYDIRRTGDDVRVLWQGGYSHFPDFQPLRKAFGEAARRCPTIKWVILGTMFSWVYQEIPQPRVEFHKWVDHRLFHMKLGTLAFDINIAPLRDDQFNRCKSAIKFYEAAALKVPTLAQNVGPYKEIIDGETGLLFTTPDEFVEKLEQLVKDPYLRRKLGNNAHDWVREHRDAMKTVVPLHQFYCKLVEEVQGRSVAA